MNSIAPILLRCVLAIALVMGGLPAWGTSTMGSQHGASVMQDAGEGGKSDCEAAVDRHQQHDADPTGSAHDCCEKDAGCEHDSCRCVCPATSVVVPVRIASAAPILRSLPPSVLNATAPRNIITTLLRPPRA